MVRGMDEPDLDLQRSVGLGPRAAASCGSVDLLLDRCHGSFRTECIVDEIEACGMPPKLPAVSLRRIKQLIKCRVNNHATQNEVEDIANLEHEQWRHVFDVNMVRQCLPCSTLVPSSSTCYPG